jgi:hypothetical protein
MEKGCFSCCGGGKTPVYLVMYRRYRSGKNDTGKNNKQKDNNINKSVIEQC